MKKRLLDRLSDISKIHSRAAFVDVEHHIKKQQGSDVFLRLADQRYSCRAFSSRPVSAAKVQKIVEAGRLAPSARNQQPVHVWVISSDDALSRLRTVHTCYDAPVVLLVGAKASEAWVRGCDGRNSAAVDAAIVGTHLMLAAADMDLQSVWIGSFDPLKLRAALPETEGWEIELLLPIGHAAAQTGPSELHKARKAFEDFVTEL